MKRYYVTVRVHAYCHQCGYARAKKGDPLTNEDVSRVRIAVIQHAQNHLTHDVRMVIERRYLSPPPQKRTRPRRVRLGSVGARK